MNFRRQPFQFTAIDPAKRQAELQKRFGLPSSNSDMYVDHFNPGFMGAGMKEPSLTGGSPRLQHRMPIFTENACKVNSEQNNVDGGHKPRVRVVPIQVEGVDDCKRHRTFSGPAGMVDKASGISKGRLQETFPHRDSTKVEDRILKPSQPRVCNIPIKIEGREEKPEIDEKPKFNPNPKTPEPAKKLKTESNGCAASKEQKAEPEPAKTVSLKQIENVLSKLQEYKEQVEKFSGTSKDKQYRYLDEMLTRCMLDLDNVDTMGLDEIRKARKEAVKQVQKYVDLLDTKVNPSVEKMESDSSTVDNLPEVSKDGEMSSDNPSEESKDAEMACDIPTEANDTVSPVVNELSEANKCTSEDVEMSGDVDDAKETVVEDVEMDDEKAEDDRVPEVPNEKKELSAKDGEMMDSVETEPENTSLELDSASISCDDQDSVIKECENKSEIIIEELDSSLVNESNVSASEVGKNGNILCIVSESPELSVKETIAEEGDSEVVIEEVDDDTSNNKDSKDITHSDNICDSSAIEQNSEEKLTVEQLNIKGDSCSVTSSKLLDNTPVVQEIIESEK